MLLAHNVFFKLKDNSPANVAKLIADCKKYLTVQAGIAYFVCGKLDATLTRDVNDRDWDVGLHIIFADRAAHDAYQTDDLHNQFIAENKATWAKVRVFDSLVERG